MTALRWALAFALPCGLLTALLVNELRPEPRPLVDPSRPAPVEPEPRPSLRAAR